jgi:hypothetical protein
MPPKRPPDVDQKAKKKAKRKIKKFRKALKGNSRAIENLNAQQRRSGRL